MTLPDWTVPRKFRRLGLYGPFALLIVVALAWSAGWFWLRFQTLSGMDATRQVLAARGAELSWASRSISGFPFRLDLDLTDCRLRGSSGSALSIPSLRAEAPVFAPDHWVAVATDGIILTRRGGGEIVVKAKVLRASFSRPGDRPPRLSVEGIGLTFTPSPGADPFFLTAAQEFHLHTRAGPGDQGAIYLSLVQASAPPTGWMGRIAEGKPLNLVVDAIYSHASAFDGRGWRDEAEAWRRAGGALAVRSLRVDIGASRLDASKGLITVGEDGRLRGSLSVDLRQAQRALGVMGQAGVIAPEAAGAAAAVLGAQSQNSRQGPVAKVTLDFQAGEATLGPAAIGPAPKIY